MTLLDRSISGAVMILAIMFIRALAIHKLPKRVFLVLWGVALARLLIPYFVVSPLSVYSLAGRLTAQQEMVPSDPLVSQRSVTVTDTLVRQAPKTWEGAGSVSGVEAPVVSVHWWTVVWLVGFLGLAGFFLISYIRCRREFSESIPVKSEALQHWLDTHRLRRKLSVRYSDKISAPLTFGILRPVILVPKAAPWLEGACAASALEQGEAPKALRDMDFVLAHEFVHIRRFDALTKLILAAALCIHWFNPAVWGMYFLANRDIELSCDEAVIRLFGENTKSAYARSLIRMEEIRSGFSPLCNNFSQNGMEERIEAIMKTKKTTRMATVIAGVLVIGVTVAFSTSGQTVSASGSTATANIAKKEIATGILTYVDPNTGKAYLSFDDGVTYTKENEIMSYIDRAQGISYYSFDGGKTWEPMTDEEYMAQSECQIEWWTEEEYARWLEEEKKQLQSLKGERAWTSGDGWFTWDQEKIDRAIALHEQTLQDIRNGWKVSRSFCDGDSAVMFGMCEDALGMCEDVSGISLATETESVDLSEYEPFGLTSRNGELFYHGKAVAFFTDRVTVEERMTFIRYDYWGQDGEVFIHTVRQAVQNTDGSSDFFGKLVGIAEYSNDEIQNDCNGAIADTYCYEQCEAVAFASENEEADLFMADFDRYAPLGITFVKNEHYGNIYYQGRLVEVLVDHSPDGVYRSFRSSDKGGKKLQTVYDSNGTLIGLEEIHDCCGIG